MSEEDGDAKNQWYRLCVIRRAPFAAPGELLDPLESLIRTLHAQDPSLFVFHGRSPAMHVVRVLEGDETRVPAFLSTSAIEWNFGRDAIDPTHEVSFFNQQDGARLAHLRVSFVAGNETSTGPGLVAEFFLGYDAGAAAAGATVGTCGERLDGIFSLLISTFQPDFGHVEMPGYGDTVERPASYDVGWITYFAHGERRFAPDWGAGLTMVRTGTGTKIFATPTLGSETHGDVAQAIAAVRARLAV